MKKHEIIHLLDLKPHVEGGYFTRTYQSPSNKMSSIYYMLTDDSPIGFLHKNKSDIIHYYHAGSALRYILLFPDGRLEEKILGVNLADGQLLQLTVSGGCWKATQLLDGEYGLISEAVSPGFEYSDMQIADDDLIKKLFSEKFEYVEKFIKR